MRKNRLAYRIWLVKEDADLMLFSDKRNLAFVRIFTFLIFAVCSSLILYMNFSGKEVPVPINIFLAAMTIIFLLVFIFKSLGHVEVELNRLSSKILVTEKRLGKTISEHEFGFNEIRNLKLISVSRRDDRGNRPDRIQNHFEILLTFNGGKDMVFSAINAPDAAAELGNKIAGFLGKKLE